MEDDKKMYLLFTEYSDTVSGAIVYDDFDSLIRQLHNANSKKSYKQRVFLLDVSKLEELEVNVVLQPKIST